MKDDDNENLSMKKSQKIKETVPAASSSGSTFASFTSTSATASSENQKQQSPSTVPRLNSKIVNELFRGSGLEKINGDSHPLNNHNVFLYSEFDNNSNESSTEDHDDLSNHDSDSLESGSAYDDANLMKQFLNVPLRRKSGTRKNSFGEDSETSGGSETEFTAQPAQPSCAVANVTPFSDKNLLVLLASLIEHVCYLYASCPEQGQLLYEEIYYPLCTALELNPISFAEDFNTDRLRYKESFEHILATTLQKINKRPQTLAIMHPSLPLFLAGATTDMHYLSNTNMPKTNFSSRYNQDFWELEKLGHGGYGSVYKVQNRLDDLFYAIKKIRINENKPHSIQKMLREVKHFAKLDNKHVVRYHSAWVELVPVSENKKSRDFDYTSQSGLTEASDDTFSQTNSYTFSDDGLSMECNPFKFDSSNNDSGSNSETAISNLRPHLFIHMQMCDHTLSDWLATRNCESNKICKGDSCYKQSLEIILQIIEGIEYIHKKGRVHRDIKPANIFLMEPDLSVKIGDFGLATDGCILDPDLDQDDDLTDFQDKPTDLTSGVGTGTYAAPEQLEGTFYTEKADIYSLGIVMFELFFPLTTRMERAYWLRNIRNGDMPTEFFEEFSEEAKIIQLLTNNNPDKRPTATELRFLFNIKGPTTKMVTHPDLDQERCIQEALRKEINEKDCLLQEQRETIESQKQQIIQLEKRLATYERNSMFGFLF